MPLLLLEPPQKLEVKSPGQQRIFRCILSPFRAALGLAWSATAVLPARTSAYCELALFAVPGRSIDYRRASKW